jgi:Ferritin-like domain
MATTSGSRPLAETLSSVSKTQHSRRRLMKLAAMGGISLAAVKMFTPAKAFATTPTLTGGPTDGATQFAAIPGNSINEKVLNFALTLEILESDLYRQALNLASDLPVDYALNVNPKVYSLKMGGGGLSASQTQVGYLYLKQFAYVEGAHRDFLVAAITAAGFTPVQKNPGGYKFVTEPLANIKSLLTAILPLEETGTRAYLGALPYLTDLGLATVAGSIYSTECRHSAAINYILGLPAGPSASPGDLTVVPNPPAVNTFEPYLQPKTVVAAVKPMFA